MHDPSGRVTIPGYYGRVHRWNGQERGYIALVSPNDAAVQRHAEVPALWGEPRFSAFERTLKIESKRSWRHGD
jgi:hypothetical protein